MYLSFIYFLYLFIYFKQHHVIQWFELIGQFEDHDYWVTTQWIIPLFIYLKELSKQSDFLNQVALRESKHTHSCGHQQTNTHRREQTLAVYLSRGRWRRPPESSWCWAESPGPSSAAAPAGTSGTDKPPDSERSARNRASDTRHLLTRERRKVFVC